MPRPKAITPSYRLHKSSGQAVVTIHGKDHYLGKHGTPESRERYRQLIAQLLTTGQSSRGDKQNLKRGPTVNKVLAAYCEFLDQTGRYVKNGRPTSERLWLKYALRPLSEIFGSTPASEFGPRKLQELRTWIASHAQESGRSLARSTVNGRIRRIVQVFRWAASMELVPAATWQSLQSVPGLRRGENTLVVEPPRIESISWSDVEAVLPYVSPQVAAMIRLQWLTGMRPGEVCAMRTGDIVRSENIWVFRPAHHKTEHHGQACDRLLGPKAQEVLKPFLRADPWIHLFSPSEAEQDRFEKRRNRQKPDGEQNSLAHLGDRYTVSSYRRAIHRACRKAGASSPWSPNQLRHARATEVRKRFGLEAAQVTLGHASADITQVYAERDRELARRVALEMG